MTTDDRGPTSEAVDPVDPADRADSATDGPEHRAGRRHLPWWQEALVLVGAAVVLAIVVKAFFVQAFYIPSNSMEPGLVVNDRILVQKVSYWFDSPERGDVVVFEDPGGWLGNTEDDQAGGVAGALAKVGLYPTGGHLVKRVIGVEGDVITCCDDEGRILVNGEPLDEDDYIRLSAADACNGPMIPCDWTAGPVPEGEVFVMGDNRGNSADSTKHLCLPDETDCTQDPFVDVDLVVGKVLAVAWPADRAAFVSDPHSFDDVPAAQE